jgi:hypothetical protein
LNRVGESYDFVTQSTAIVIIQNFKD